MDIVKINELIGAASLDKGKQSRINEILGVLIENPNHVLAMDNLVHVIEANKLSNDDEKKVRENLYTVIGLAAKEVLNGLTSEKDKINRLYGKPKVILEAITAVNSVLDKISKDSFKFERGMGSAPRLPESKEAIKKESFKWSKSDNALSPLSGKEYSTK